MPGLAPTVVTQPIRAGFGSAAAPLAGRRAGLVAMVDGGKRPFGWRVGAADELVANERERAALGPGADHTRQPETVTARLVGEHDAPDLSSRSLGLLAPALQQREELAAGSRHRGSRDPCQQRGGAAGAWRVK